MITCNDKTLFHWLLLMHVEVQFHWFVQNEDSGLGTTKKALKPFCCKLVGGHLGTRLLQVGCENGWRVY